MFSDKDIQAILPEKCNALFRSLYYQHLRNYHLRKRSRKPVRWYQRTGLRVSLSDSLKIGSTV